MGKAHWGKIYLLWEVNQGEDKNNTKCVKKKPANFSVPRKKCVQ